MIATQVTEIISRPDPARIRPVRNPPFYPGGNLRQWLISSYCGNKPDGGLWTSTYGGIGEYISDWHRGRETNLLIQMAYPVTRGLSAWLLDIEPSARVLEIANLEGAVDFTRRYHAQTVPLAALGLGPAITPEITDWERAMKDYDAILLTASAADEIAYAAATEGRTDTAFHAWNCESMFAGRWVFSGVRLAPESR